MKRKNILFVFTDQWRRSAMGAYGEEPVKTPHMDEFADRYLLCTDANSACPLCSPARASLISGQYPLKTGLFTNCKNGSDVHLRESDICIGDVLKANGYQNGYIGKWHLDEPECNKVEHPVSGATRWDAYTPVGPKRHGFDYWHTYNAYDKHLKPHYWEDTPEMIEVDQWSPIHETDKALEFMENRDKDKPFCLFVAWNPPHPPYHTAPEKYKKMYEDMDYLRDNVDVKTLDKVMCHTYEPFPMTEEEERTLVKDYFAAVTGLDDQFKRLVDYLEKEDILKDTIVVLTADHGDMLGSHTLIQKHVWYEESVGIPFVIGGADIGRGKCGTVFSSQDIPSTLLSLLDIEIPQSWDGKDLSEDFRNATTDEESYTFLVNCPGRDIVIKKFREEGKNILSAGWRAIRTRRYTFVIDCGYDTVPVRKYYLYDNMKDPLQMHPLEGEDARNTEIGRKLESKLVSWLKEQKDPILDNLA